MYFFRKPFNQTTYKTILEKKNKFVLTDYMFHYVGALICVQLLRLKKKKKCESRLNFFDDERCHSIILFETL